MGIVGLGVAAAVALTACSTSAAEPKGKTTLTMLTFNTPSITPAFWNESIGTALKSVPGVTIKQVLSPDADRDAYAKKLQASGQFPDIQSSIDPIDFVGAKLLKPFPQSWLNANFVLPNGNAIAGKSYIPPTNSQIIPLLYYNKAIFTKNNITVPTTYAEFVTAVKALRAANITPIELDGADPWAASMPIVALASTDVLGKDPKWISQRYAGKVHFTDPDFVAAMQKEENLIKMGAYSPSALSVDFATANKQFLAGQAGMYLMGSWFNGSSYMTPDQAKAFGVVPFPTDSGKIVVPFNSGGTTSVSAKSKDVTDAVKFAEAWSLAPANLKTLITTDGAYPMMKNEPLSSFHATVSSLFTSSYKLVTGTNEKVDAFGWVTNGDSLAPGMNDKFYAFSQALFSNSDVKGQLAQLDTEWDQATAK
jgi:ABC-type glycerol-3-phosphate transport system substrate-binding protein